MSTSESLSNLAHRELTQAFSACELTTEKAKFLLVTTALESLTLGPTSTIRHTVDLLCAAHAAGKDINIFRLALVEMDEIARGEKK